MHAAPLAAELGRYKLLHAVANRIAWLALAMLSPLSVAAASNAALEACTKLSDDSARLACFDREVAALIAREHAPAPVAAAPPAAAAPAPAPAKQLTEEEKMGLTPGRIQQLERPPSAPPPPDTMSVDIQSIAVDANGYQVFTLANGQVWRQVERDTTFRVKAGDSIVISRGVMGSYFLSYGKHRNTRVSRVH
jgi:hypothetical protein